MQQQKMHRCPTGLLDPHDLEDCSSCKALLEIFLRLPLPERRKLPLVCKKWRRVALGSPELWRRVQVSLPADFLSQVDVWALYQWFVQQADAIRELELEIGSADCWLVINGLVGILGRRLQHLRVEGDSEEECYEAGGTAAWMALVPRLKSLEIENAAEWTIGVAAHFPPELTRLELCYCGEEGLPSVPQHLSRLSGLVSLSLKGAQLDSCASLAPLQQCTRLQSLNLSDCCLEDVPPCLGALGDSLTSLTLSLNAKLGGEDNELQVAPLAALRNLQLLEMRDCQLVCVPRSVTGLTSLRTLLLAMNCMSAAQERFVLPGPYLQGLALLGLSDCFDEDSGVSVERLAGELEGATGLEVLRLNRNMGLTLTTAGLDALLSGKPLLRRLDFSRDMAGPDLDLDALHAQFHGVRLVYTYS